MRVIDYEVCNEVDCDACDRLKTCIVFETDCKHFLFLCQDCINKAFEEVSDEG